MNQAGKEPVENSLELIPVQIEKKCFFIRPVMINQAKWWQRLCCFPGGEKKNQKGKQNQETFGANDKSGSYASMNNSKSEILYDHYQDVTEKFPDEVYKQLMPAEHA